MTVGCVGEHGEYPLQRVMRLATRPWQFEEYRNRHAMLTDRGIAPHNLAVHIAMLTHDDEGGE